jgi:epoxyqueuosine reductase QueG
VNWIRGLGFRAVAPVLQGSFLQFPRVTGDITSNWSERHACFVAGLGTFGLSRGLITARGKAVRVGTVVTDMPLEPTRRPSDEPFEACLYLTAGACGRCMARCPAGAITPAGQDKQKCQAHQILALRRRGRSLGLGRHLTGLHLSCGLCQTAVPCEAGIPRATADSGLSP